MEELEVKLEMERLSERDESVVGGRTRWTDECWLIRHFWSFLVGAIFPSMLESFSFQLGC